MQKFKYQCVVSTKKEEEKRIGPQWDQPDPPGMLAEAINRAVAMGKEKTYRDARVIRIVEVVV